MANKVKIELTPYNALSILSFLREFVNDDNVNEPAFKAIHEAVDEYNVSLIKHITPEQVNDGQQENQVNQLIGKSPIRK
jgi:hypothetical protein